MEPKGTDETYKEAEENICKFSGGKICGESLSGAARGGEGANYMTGWDTCSCKTGDLVWAGSALILSPSESDL